MESKKYVTNVVEVDENIKILEFVEVMIKKELEHSETRCFDCDNLVNPKNNIRDPFNRLWWCKEHKIQATKEFFLGKEPKMMLADVLIESKCYTPKKPKKKNLDAFL